MPSLRDIEFIVLDTETTGADPTKDLPIEIAIVKVKDYQIGVPESWFIDPGRPIPPEASAVHHLVDEDLIGAKTLEELWPHVNERIGNGVIVAHNAQFDIGMLPELQGRPYICTLRLARHLWQKGDLNKRGFPLAAHQQQVLRYWLGLVVDTQGLAAHRAAADILVTSELLNEQIKLYLECGGEDDLDSLLEFIDRPIEITKLPFGKYANQLLADIPQEYLEYLIEKSGSGAKPMDEDLKASIKRELDRRKAETIISTRLGVTPEKTADK